MVVCRPRRGDFCVRGDEQEIEQRAINILVHRFALWAAKRGEYFVLQ